MPDWWKENRNLFKIGSSSKMKTYLDLGCGKGDTQNFIEEGHWVGLDIDISKKITIQGDFYNLPFRDNVFDVAMSFKTLEHLPKINISAEGVKKVLKKNGYFIGSVAFLEPYHNSYYHFTHLGVENFLTESGFIIEEITAGWSVFEALINWLIPFHNLNKPLLFLTRILYKTLLFTRSILYKTYFKYSGQDRKRLSIALKTDEFKWAGEIRFIAYLDNKDARA